MLENIGLTKGETKVYLALLELGSSTAGNIITSSKISPSKIYDVLQRLIDKGLVSYIFQGKIKYFKAAPPNRILTFIEKQKEELLEKEADFKNILPVLELKQKSAPKNQTAEIFEGMRGIKTFLDMTFTETPRKSCVYAFGYPVLASKLFNAYFKEYHKKRVRHNIYAKIIYNHDTWFFKKREPRKLCQQRYMPKGIETPTYVYIFGDIVGTICITEDQKICFMIKNREVAQSYIKYFNILWKQAIIPK